MRLSEVYTSVQGEGPNTGALIQFVRFGGCNMRCPGWPCDTEYAIDPRFRDEWERITPSEIVDRIDEFPKHLCLTGGEPLIQVKTEMEEFGHKALSAGYHIDLFTNGSQILPDWTLDPKVVVVMDWKLPGSGEEYSGIVMRRGNYKALRPKDAVKFVVKDYADLEAARNVWDNAQNEVLCQTYVGRAWDTITDQEIIEYMLRYGLPWKLNVQIHKHLWDPTLRGV